MPASLTRTRRSRLNAPASRRVSHTALDGTKRRPHAPQARSLYSLNTTSRVGLAHPLRNRWEETRRETSLRSDERSRSPESVFTFPGFGVQLHRNAQPCVPNGRLRHMLIGYARVSMADGSQSLDLQRDALQAAAVDAVEHGRFSDEFLVERDQDLALFDLAPRAKDA